MAYRLRWKRREFLWRSWRSRHDLTALADRTDQIGRGDILCFATVRNEMARLPYFLSHHRALGVGHFLFVVNASEDGTGAFLADQPDVSVWHTQASYKAARFGMDWLGYLQMCHAHGHWALTLDADETLLYPGSDATPLPALTQWLEGQGAIAMSALMLDLYPKGRLSSAQYTPGTPPWEALPWFDAEGYTWEFLPKFRVISIRGGTRKRFFFGQTPDHAPHLHKTPLVKWHRHFAYASSTHHLLPRHLNAAFDARKGLPTGVLMHSKFLNHVVDRSREEKLRAEHFTHSERYDAYYDQIASDPDLWYPGAIRYQDTAQLEHLGLMTRGAWPGS